MSMIIQSILVVAILAAMVMILLGIRRLVNFDVYDDPKKTVSLARDLLEEEDIITENSAFKPLLERQRCQNSISRGPSSRKL